MRASRTSCAVLAVATATAVALTSHKARFDSGRLRQA
ncbi:hypothetical protein EV641_106189 [Rhodococcus sp. SMB37]|nr:hypothetical protein EV641_106189 [Rhodococcus sp. SMB37]